MEAATLINGPVNQETISLIIGNLIGKTETGAHSIFLGMVRADKIEGKAVVAIEYSAYEAMVKAEVLKIKEMIFSEFSEVKIIEILHSAGQVRTGEISLFVLVSAGHRHQAIEACAKTVELIKERLPVWKKEIFDDDSSHWRGNN
jgi:molybdopterin synthase catalytic subunit